MRWKFWIKNEEAIDAISKELLATKLRIDCLESDLKRERCPHSIDRIGFNERILLGSGGGSSVDNPPEMTKFFAEKICGNCEKTLDKYWNPKEFTEAKAIHYQKMSKFYSDRISGK